MNAVMNDEVIHKRYYNTREVSNELGVAESAVRFWDRVFGLEIARGRRSGGKARLFTVEDLALFKEIHRLLKVEHYTIIGAKKKIKIPIRRKVGYYPCPACDSTGVIKDRGEVRDCTACSGGWIEKKIVSE